MDLHLSFGDDQWTTIGKFVDALIRIEFIYNIFAFMADGSEPTFYSLEDKLLDEKYSVPHSVINDAGIGALSKNITIILEQSIGLRQRIDTKFQLHVHEISTGSFKISVSGIAEAIHALAKIFDPLQRNIDREQLRHDLAMDQFEEEERAIYLLAKRLELLEDVQKCKERMVRRYEKKGYSYQSVEAAFEPMLMEVAGSKIGLKSDGAELIAIPKDNHNGDN